MQYNFSKKLRRPENFDEDNKFDKLPEELRL